MSSTPTRPASQTSEPERAARRERRKSIDERSDRGSEYGGGRKGSAKSPGPGGVLSRLEQHERMLAERERERREHQRLVSLGRAPSRGELRPRSVTETESDRDLPSYMRSTSASSKKEKLTGGPAGPAERSRRRSSTSQSQGDLRRIPGELQDTSSEEDASWRAPSHPRATSSDRRHHGERPGPGRAKSERDLSRVARVNLSAGSSSRDNVATPVQKQRAKMKTTTIISNDGAVVVKHPEPQFSARGTEAVDVTRAPLSRQLAEVRMTLSVITSSDLPVFAAVWSEDAGGRG